MELGEYNMTINQGATYSLSMVWYGAAGVPIDLTDASATLTGRVNPLDDGETAVVTWSSTGPAPNITLDAVGNIVLTVTDEQTALLSFDVINYNLFVTLASGVTHKLLWGTITLVRRY